ncbi:hypothetical protein [Oceaniglobus ichthyenteri]|uniref:hypothetical protein n=1 Tax=Oceaniglobus ichthyenteri TaxID=2136177 RepID=UPI000F83EB70|nr:hypothetical protein [Oceaniglobus ichthyenteri]
MTRNFRASTLITAVCFSSLLAAGTCTLPGDGDKISTVDAMKSMAESASYEALGPAGTAAELLLKADDLTTAALTAFYQRKGKEAALEGDFDAADRWQAHIDCLVSKNCAEFNEIEKKRRLRDELMQQAAKSSGGGSH